VKLGTRIYLIASTAVVLLVAVGLVAIWVLGSRWARDSLRARLAQNAELLQSVEGDRMERLQLLAELFASDANLVAFVAEAMDRSDSLSILDVLIERQADVGFDFALVTDPDGVLLVHTDRPDESGAALAGGPLMTVALERFRAAGFWSEGGRLYQGVAVPLVIGRDLLGFLVTAYGITDSSALAARRLAHTEVTYLVGVDGRLGVVGSTLASPAAAEVALDRAVHDAYQSLSPREPTAVAPPRPEAVELDIGSERWFAQLRPLWDARGAPVGAWLIVESLDRALSPFRRIGLILAAAGLLAALAVSLIAWWTTSRALAPVRDLVRATSAARQGDYSTGLPTGRPDEVGQLAAAFSELLGELREMELYVAELSRNLTVGESKTRRLVDAVRLSKSALLGLELRHLGAEIDAPEAVAEGLASDLAAIEEVVVQYRGRVRAIAGHRIWATFEGSEQALRAVAVATSVQLRFRGDERVPPACAVTSGAILLGGERELTAGRPVQWLETLLREAAPGDLLLGSEAAMELSFPARQREVEVRPRRGLLTAASYYELDAKNALRLSAAASVEPRDGEGYERRLTPGSRFGSRFEILSELGEGGMGVVYKARDRELEDVVALKVLSPDASWGGRSVDALREELKLARLITHPNVLRVYDLGDVAGTPFISMEYVAGVTLRQLLERSPQIPLAAALRIARQVCSGLAAVHGAGVVHGDLKPENVILDPTGTARLMDFGVSRRRDAVVDADSKEQVSGTPRYFAPEQIRDGITDSLSDLYTCGVLLFELFTGAFPYPPAKSLALVVRTTLELAPTPPREVRAELPHQLERIILTSLNKDRDQRFRSAEDLLRALEAVDLREPRAAVS